MTTLTDHFICPLCFRFLDASGAVVVPQPKVLAVGVPERECNTPECAGLASPPVVVRPPHKKPEPHVARQRAGERATRRASAAARPSCANVHPSQPPERDDEPLPVVQPPPHGESALAHESSGNAWLLNFFLKPENFNVPFRSTDLEQWCGSSRMNNRAIWLRAQVLSKGWYVDNDPNGAAWDLPRGSWYRVCKLEDATSLDEDTKRSLMVQAGLREAEQREF